MRSTSLSSASTSCSDRGALHEHLDANVVADRHLVDEPAEIALQLGEARRQLIPALSEIRAHSPKKFPVKWPFW